MATIPSASSILTPTPPKHTQNPTTKPISTLFFNYKPNFCTFLQPLKFNYVSLSYPPPPTYSTELKKRRLNAVAEETVVSTAADPTSEAARRLYVGNIPRNLGNDELKKIVEEHGSVEKAEVMYDKWSKRSRRFAFVTMKTVEDATAAAEKLNGTEVGGREIKVNVTEKPLTVDVSVLQAEETPFTDSPHKVYVGNLAKGVTTEKLQSFFSGKGKVLSAKVSRVPGTSKSSGYGFVTFSSEDEVEAAISSLNDQVLEGQKIRVNKA